MINEWMFREYEGEEDKIDYLLELVRNRNLEDVATTVDVVVDSFSQRHSPKN